MNKDYIRKIELACLRQNDFEEENYQRREEIEDMKMRKLIARGEIWLK